MKIEFRCVDCHRLLRVAHVHVGSQIACPACQSSLRVPDPATDESASLVPPLPPGEPQNRTWDPQTVSFSRVLQDTWTLYVQNMGMLLIVTLIDLLLWVMGVVLIFVPAVGTFAVLQRAIGIPVPFSVLGMIFVLMFGFMYLVNAMTCSQTKFFLKVARGEPTSIRDAFHIGWNTGAITMLPTIFAFFCFSGLLLCVVPGVCVYLFFWPYIWIWADRQTGGRESQAFPLAREISSRNVATSMAISAIGIGMTVVGLNFFGYSLFGLLKAVAYLRMTGQELTGLDRGRLLFDEPSESVDPA